MANHYDKIAEALKRIKIIQDLITQGLAKPAEKAEALELAKKGAELFTDDIFKRRAEKQSRATAWSKVSHDGFVPADEASQLDAWIELLDEYLEKRRIRTNVASEKTYIQSVIDGEDQHIFISEKGSQEHSHLIIDGGTGEIRIDPKDKAPHELIKSVRAEVELNTGDTVRIAGSSISFVEPQAPRPDIRAYTANKDGYFVVELYNNGDEDLEDFRVVANWVQPPPEGAQERVLEKFNDVTDYLVMAHPRSLNMLKQGTRVYVNGVPSISIDKKIKITISCKGMTSGKKIENIFELETPKRYN